MTPGQLKKRTALNTAIFKAQNVLKEIDEYHKSGRNKAGIRISLMRNCNFIFPAFDIAFPEIEDEVLSVIYMRYSRLIELWKKELEELNG